MGANNAKQQQGRGGEDHSRRRDGRDGRRDGRDDRNSEERRRRRDDRRRREREGGTEDGRSGNDDGRDARNNQESGSGRNNQDGSGQQQSAGNSRQTTDVTQGQTSAAGSTSPRGVSHEVRDPPPKKEVDKKDTVPVVFTWTHGGKNVFLIGSFNNWAEKLPMVRSGLEFHIVVNLTKEEHQYKFIADDMWRYSSDYPIVNDDLGNIHNVMDVSQYQPYDLFKLPDSELPSIYSQNTPNFSEYTTEPPTIPVVLAKSTFVAVEPPMAKMPPNIPLHCIAHHFYHDYGRTVQPRLRKKQKVYSDQEVDTFLRLQAERQQLEKNNNNGSTKQDRVLLMAVTHRFERQFTTSVLVTGGSRWPCKQETSSQSAAASHLWGVNPDGTRYVWKPVNPLRLCYSTRKPYPNKSSARIPTGQVRPSAAKDVSPGGTESEFDNTVGVETTRETTRKSDDNGIATIDIDDVNSSMTETRNSIIDGFATAASAVGEGEGE